MELLLSNAAAAPRPATARRPAFRSDDRKSACERHLIEAGVAVATRKREKEETVEVRLTRGAMSRKCQVQSEAFECPPLTS